jgi:protein-S-isoprenylcysteine O-methyltransferase Ste14
MGGVATGVLTFATAAFVLVLLLFVTAGGVALSTDSQAKQFRTTGPAIKRWSGRVLIVIGTWLIIIGWFARTAQQVLFP